MRKDFRKLLPRLALATMIMLLMLVISMATGLATDLEVWAPASVNYYIGANDVGPEVWSFNALTEGRVVNATALRQENGWQNSDMPTWTVTQTAGTVFNWRVGDQNWDKDEPKVDIRLDDIPNTVYDAEITIKCDWHGLSKTVTTVIHFKQILLPQGISNIDDKYILKPGDTFTLTPIVRPASWNATGYPIHISGNSGEFERFTQEVSFTDTSRTYKVKSDAEPGVYYCLVALGSDTLTMGRFVPFLVEGADPIEGEWGNLKWSFSLNKRELNVSGSGPMNDMTWDKVNAWQPYREYIDKIIVGDGITCIGRNAFDGCINMDTLELPLSVTTTYEDSFQNCDSLTDVYYGGSVNDRNKIEFRGNSCLENANWIYANNSSGGSSGGSSSSVPLDIKDATISLIADQTYTGNAIKPALTVTLNGKTLTDGTDFTVSFANNTNVGTAKVTITGKGNYFGSKEATFKIIGISITKCTIDAIANQVYFGDALKPDVIVKWGGAPLINGSDYSVAYSNNINAGMATVTVTGKGNYTDSQSITFQIDPASVESAVFDPLADAFYSGTAIQPQPVFSVNGRGLVLGTDYTLTYTNNVEVGVATITVTGNGNYTGTASTTFKILSIDMANVTISAIPDQTYTGKAIEPTVSVSYQGTPLTAGTDYTVAYSNNINAGTAAVIVTGKTHFYGDIQRVFRILRVDISKAKISSIKDQEYTGKAIHPKITIKLNGKTLAKEKDYIVSFKDNKNIGKATVTVSGKGNYTGKTKVTFDICPETMKISSVKAGQKQLTVTWKEDREVDGYQIEYGLKKDFKDAKRITIKKKSTTQAEIKKLKANKKYFVRIRSYKKVKGTTYYSEWSKAVSRKTEK